MVAAVAFAGPVDSPWRVWSDPTEFARYRSDYTVTQRSSFSPDPCLYGSDGHPLTQPGSLACRYDHLWEQAGRHRYLRREGAERVLLDERGAGALTRVWMTTGQGVSAAFSPQARLRLRLDQDPVPFLDIAVNDWFDGQTWPFLWPLVGDRETGVGASYGYVPVLFRDRLQISLVLPEGEGASEQLPIWYQFQVQRSASADAEAPGFPADLADWHSFVSQPIGSYPWPQTLSWQHGESVLPAASENEILNLTDGGTLLSLRLRPDDEREWQNLALSVEVDGETTIEQSMLDLFGVESGPEDSIQALLLGIDSDGYGYLHLPMPFQHQLRLRLRNLGGEGIRVSHQHALHAAAPPTDALRLRVHGHDTCVHGSRLAPDLTLLDLHGRGRLVGVVSRQHHLPGSDHLGGISNYLEGDERIYLDDSPHPQWHGTGNEDFYNGGFYFDRGGNYGFAHRFALHGGPWHAMTEATPAASRMYRLLLTDALPFHSRLQVRLERGAYGNQPMCSRGIALVYHEHERGLEPVSALDLSDPDSVLAASYTPPPDAECNPQQGAFMDEPPTFLSAWVCRFVGSSSEFRFELERPAQRLWLRRRFDGSHAGQSARVEVNGRLVGAAPYSMAQPERRWQDVDLPLDLPPQPAGTELHFRILPEEPLIEFTEVAYMLLADSTEVLFADGFERYRGHPQFRVFPTPP